MWFWNKILTSAASLSLLAWASQCSVNTKAGDDWKRIDSIENIKLKNADTLEIITSPKIQEKTQKEISICLDVDDENSFTHTNVLEQISDPQNTILEYPLAQLFKRYGNKPHPYRVSWIGRDFSALLWKNWIEEISTFVPQKLKSRAEWITSDTKYEIWDTLRFPLINPLLQWEFPQQLSEQLQEDWFESFSDADSLDIAKRQNEKKYSFFNDKEKSDFIYDIIVKRLSSWKSALALYRDWELFMATYVSVWLNSKRTKTWQFKIWEKQPYRRSHKYGNAPMSGALHVCNGIFIHQWYVTGYNLSHGCIRVPAGYEDLLYSLIKNIGCTDIFISKDLYKIKK